MPVSPPGSTGHNARGGNPLPRPAAKNAVKSPATPAMIGLRRCWKFRGMIIGVVACAASGMVMSVLTFALTAIVASVTFRGGDEAVAAALWVALGAAALTFMLAVIAPYARTA